MRRTLTAMCAALAALAWLQGCVVDEADADPSPFLTIAVPLRTPEVPGPQRIEVVRTLWTTLADEPGARREVRLRLGAIVSHVSGRQQWSEITLAVEQGSEAGGAVVVPQQMDRRADGSWTAEWPQLPGLEDLVSDEAERVASAWEDDPLHPGKQVSSGASWVLEVARFLDSPTAGPLRGLQIDSEQSSGYAHAAGLLPYHESLVWTVEGHLRLGPTEVPRALLALLLEHFDELAAVAAQEPFETRASIRLRQRSNLPEPRDADTRRDETVEFTIRWSVDGHLVEAGLLETRTRAAR